MVGLDLASEASSGAAFSWDEGAWAWPHGHGRHATPRRHVVVVDFGVKRNILRSLVTIGARVSVVAARSSAGEILALKPDGVVLSNGPGDPAATAEHAAPMIRRLVESGVPVFGICLGHQLLALAMGGRTEKMEQGHHGANHPVKDLATGQVDIVSMNHGFTVARDSLPAGVVRTYVSLFDGTNAGAWRSKADRCSPVQHHPEASPRAYGSPALVCPLRRDDGAGKRQDNIALGSILKGRSGLRAETASRFPWARASRALPRPPDR